MHIDRLIFSKPRTRREGRDDRRDERSAGEIVGPRAGEGGEENGKGRGVTFVWSQWLLRSVIGIYTDKNLP